MSRFHCNWLSVFYTAHLEEIDQKKLHLITMNNNYYLLYQEVFFFVFFSSLLMCAVDLEEYCYSLAIDQKMGKKYEIARGVFKVISECVNTFGESEEQLP